MIRIQWLAISAFLVLCSMGFSAQTLINVDVQASGNPVQSGPAVLGAAGDIWNSASASIANLLDSAGTATGVVFNFNPDGGFGFNQGATQGNPAITNLMRDYWFNGVWGTVSFSGIIPGEYYKVVCFSGEYSKTLTMTFMVDGVTKSIVEDGLAYPYPLIEGTHYVVFEGTVPANGEILVDPSGPVVNGFQLLLGKHGAAHSPVPQDRNTAVDSTAVTSVSWYSPLQDRTGAVISDPNISSVNGYNVYFRTTEPNDLTDTPVSTNQPGQSRAVSLNYDTTYYWRVDTHVTWDSNDLIVKGKEWQFKTKPQYIAPTLTFNNVITALTLLPANLSAGVTGNTNAITSVTFTLLTSDPEYPAGAIASVTSTTTNNQNPTATLTTNMAGKYKVKLVISDGTTSVEKVAEVNVYADACAAKKAAPSGWTADYFDKNGDCIIDTDDLVDMADEWLNQTIMTSPETYQANTVYRPVDFMVQAENLYAPTDPNYTDSLPLTDWTGPRIETYGDITIVNWVQSGNFLTYQITIPTGQGGAYTLYVKASYMSPNRLISVDKLDSVSLDGNPLNDTLINLGAFNVGGNNGTGILGSGTVTLPEGTYLIRVTTNSGGLGSYDYFGFKKQ